MLERNVMGFEGFYWAIGVVEDRQDPLAIGRVRARAWGIHTENLSDIPTDSLPWAQVASSVNLQLKEGDSVLMFFADGRSCQIPIIIAKLEGFYVTQNNPGAGFNDVRTSAVLQNAPRPPAKWEFKTDGSGITVTNPDSANAHPTTIEQGQQTISPAADYNIANTVIQQRLNNLDKNVPAATGLTWSEPVPAYNPLYPYNKAYSSESGHIIEVDDTIGNERLTWTHRTGTFIDMYPSGTRVQKVTKSNYTIVMGDDYVHIMGRCLLTVGQGVYIKALGDVNLECDSDLNVGVAGSAKFSVAGSFDVKAGSVNIQSEGDATLLGSSVHVTSSGTADIVGSTTNIGGTVNIPGGLNAAGAINLAGSVLAGSINPGPGPAGPASSGSGASVPAPPAKGTPTTGSAGLEEAPVPWNQNFAKLTPYAALALQQAQMLDDSGNAPDANVSNTKQSTSSCGFDPNTHTFLPQPWAISQAGITALQQREGFAKALPNGTCQAYPDPVLGPALLTIGFGTTSCVLPPQDALTPTTIISRATAQQYLLDAINNIFLPYLQQVVQVDLTQNQIDALLSFMYNVGTNNFAKSSVLKFTNQQDWCSAGSSFLLWNKSGGQVVAGLTKRRTSEKSQYLT